MIKFLNGSIVQLATAYRTKEVSPVEIIRLLFNEIEHQEKQLNAFITLLEKEALEAAKIAEKQFINGNKVHILCGVPYTLKDLVYTKNVTTTCGSLILKDFLPKYNATIYKKLNDTGAILIGKTNMLEFAYGIVHPHYGKTNNPWDNNRTAGGSSGGSAAAVAAHLGFFSIGTDTGGSIRIPASYCGVVGLKPTYGAVSLRGIFPLSWSLDHAGPIAKTVEDVAIVFEAIAGHDPKDPYSSAYASYKAFDLSVDKPKVMGILPESYFESVQSEVIEVYKKTLRIVEELGWVLKEIEIKDWVLTESSIMKVLLPEAAYIHKPWFNRKEEYALLTFKQIETGLKQEAIEYIEGLEKQKNFREIVDSIFIDVNVLVMPTVSFPAPEEDPAIGDIELNEMTFTGLFNLSGHPAITINRGFSKENLPIGMQFVGKYFGEEELLSVVRKVEQLNI